MRAMPLTDGRTLAYEDYGDPEGRPVVFTHGFGDSRLIRHPD
ncbi:alpha/beta fold hydrolase [Streptomyces sp. NPDC006879]